jgi:hypothetical protein
MASLVCTLYENHYDTGVAALINSLINNSFEGKIAVGYRGNLPYWLGQLRQEGGKFWISKEVEIVLDLLDTDWHFTYYKPEYLLKVLHDYPDVDKAYYFDPDIFNRCPWTFYEEWVESGIAVCLDDCLSFMPSGHPFRREWKKLGEQLGLEVVQELNFYCNAGFVGLRRQDKLLLETWSSLLHLIIKKGYNIRAMKEFGREHAVVTDQDLLNAALMLTKVDISAIGPDGMDFTGGGFLMSHATSSPKPWKQHFVPALLKNGRIPSRAEREFFQHLTHPIQVLKPRERWCRKTDLRLAAILGRLIGH